MKNIGKNNSGFSIVIAMLMTIFIGLTATYILEYIIPFGRNVKGIENASKSYYQANSGIEESLWYISQNDLGDEDSKIISTSSIDYSYNIIANSSQIPLSSSGDSGFDSDWNIISKGNSVQLEVGNNRVSPSSLWNTIYINLRVPDTLGSGTAYSLIGGTQPVINWQLSSIDNTLNSSDSAFTYTDVNSGSSILLGSMDGVELDGTPRLFRDFYNANCGSSQSCILKFSVIGDLTGDGGAFADSSIPYLEYQINFGTAIVPLRFTQVEASGKSFGFRKDLNVRVPQLTVDGAFDFTVLQ